MNHRNRFRTAGLRASVAALAIVLAAAACATPAADDLGAAGTPTATSAAPPTITAPPTVAPVKPAITTKSTPAVDPKLIFAADGIGPYTLGKSLATLQGAGLVADLFTSPICPGVKIGKSTGWYAGKLRLVFDGGGKLWYIDTKATDLQTPSGGKIGMTIVKLTSIYASKGTVIPSGGGSIGGLLVKVAGTPLAIVFLRDNTGKAFSMSAGPADVVESFASGGEGC